MAQGFDNTFAFFSFDTVLSTEKSISSFKVTVTSTGTTTTFDNNGNGFIISDTVLFQRPQSCLDGNGRLTAIAAVRKGSESNATLTVVVKNPRESPSVIPSLATVTAPMASESTVGSYVLYSATYQFNGSQADSALFNVSASGLSDSFNSPNGLPRICATLSTQLPFSPPNTTFSFLGCYSDTVEFRTLSAASTRNDNMAVEQCATFCNRYAYFGLEYGAECYCGDALLSSSSEQPLTDCNFACVRDANETCGAGNRLSTYQNLAYAPPAHPVLAGYNYTGCFNDDVNQRVLTASFSQSDSLTYAACADTCKAYEYFGVEYGSQCFCGTLPSDTPDAPDSDCNIRCTGNSSQTCGGASRLTVFESTSPYQPPSNPVIPGYDYAGCYTDSVENRTLADTVFTGIHMTVETCEEFCDGAAYFGLEYGSECYCGDALRSGIISVWDDECSFLCSGNEKEFCGAGDRLSVWKKVEE